MDSQVTGAHLSVLADPTDPCRLHLSGTITTNGPMDVEYRFLNQYGQPSNTYTIAVDHTGVASFGGHADIPVGTASASPGGQLAPIPGGSLGGVVAEQAEDAYTGVCGLEIVSAEYLSPAVDGFSVPYCPRHQIDTRRNIDTSVGFGTPTLGTLVPAEGLWSVGGAAASAGVGLGR
ncbi:MAG: hypothetical protein HRT86_06375 [Ilumatobacteraceae bacterium]|nr:hypothetical protein [Ilumatobacteraceae bacterium]